MRNLIPIMRFLKHFLFCNVLFHFHFTEQLSLGEYAEPKSKNWEKDYELLILPALQDGQPCYILYRCGNYNKKMKSSSFVLNYNGMPGWIHSKIMVMNGFYSLGLRTIAQFGKRCYMHQPKPP